MDSSFHHNKNHKKAGMVPSKKKKRVCIVRNTLNKDGISELPDDILIHIVSSIPVKEAGKTSVLSKRWKHVWEYMTTLNFDADNLSSHKKLKNIDKDSYCNTVEHVLRSHKASRLDEFRVCYDFYPIRDEKIDNWIRFAIEKRVKRLELNIKPFTLLNVYNFPSLSFGNMLISIELANVSVTGENLERLLYEYQSLEVMSVENSITLVSLKVAGPSLSLKSLRINSCLMMVHLEIFAPNLMSCYYVGPKLQSSPFKSTPKLVKLYIGGSYGNRVFYNRSNLSSCISQIEMLSLNSLYLEIARVAKVFPECTRLKVLHVKVNLISEDELFALHFLIKACPLLRKFVLELNSTHELKSIGRTRNDESCLYYHLVIVEVIGFVGYEADMEFVKYLIGNAHLLEKIIIRPTKPTGYHHNGTALGLAAASTRRRAITQAGKLSSYLKLWTELQIIC